MSAEALERAVFALHDAHRVLVVTGAGISAESGIPTFRGEGGLWKGFAAQDLATPEAFARDPDLVWEWYGWRKGICNAAEPNPGHVAIARLEASRDVLLATQNVDGLHRRAGSDAPVELHGCIDQMRCTGCHHIEGTTIPEDRLPECSECGSLARPHILWFGETYWPGILERAQAFARRAQVVLVVGTSAQIWPPIALALMAQQSGAVMIDVNPNRTDLSAQADIWLQGNSGEVLPDLVERAI